MPELQIGLRFSRSATKRSLAGAALRRDRRTHASTQHLSTWLEIIAEKVFLNTRVNIFSNTLKLHTKAHTAVRGEPN